MTTEQGSDRLIGYFVEARSDGVTFRTDIARDNEVFSANVFAPLGTAVGEVSWVVTPIVERTVYVDKPCEAPCCNPEGPEWDE